MKFQFSQSVILPSRPLTERVFAGISDALRVVSLRLSVSLLAGALIATATPTSAEATHPQTTSKAGTQEGMVGVFTGEFVDGAPVYRLPSVIVVAARKVELVKMEREEQATRAKEARTRAAARRCAQAIC